MKKSNRNFITEEISQIPVVYLIELEMAALDKLENQIKDEVRRTPLALKWIQGIKCIKKASKDGGRYGE